MVKILGAFTAMDAGLIPGWGVKIPQIMSRSQKKIKIKTKQYKSFPLINTRNFKINCFIYLFS